MNGVTALRSVVRGRVHLPGDDGFGMASRPWNLAVDQPVAAVVEAADADDIAALVRHAREAGLGISVQPSGHGASGRARDTVLLRTKALSDLQVDPEANRALVGAGVAFGTLQAAAARHQLTGLPGSSPMVSVAGVVLGGGLSWFGRTFGWIGDSNSAFDIVDASGTQRRVDAVTDPDLFWALRGGGGDFAIVTGLSLSMHPAPRFYGGRMLWPGAQAALVMEAYRQVTASAPDRLTLWLSLAHFPGADPVVVIDITYLGHENEARDLLAPLDRLARPLSDSRQAMPITDLPSITGDPTSPGASLSRAELLSDLDNSTVTALLSGPIAPLLAVQVRHLGGAFTLPTDSPHGRLTEPYLLYMLGVPSSPEVASATTAKQDELAGAVRTSGRKPFTFLNPRETAADAFSPGTLSRLRDIKARHDPDNVFRSNFPVGE